MAGTWGKYGDNPAYYQPGALESMYQAAQFRLHGKGKGGKAKKGITSHLRPGIHGGVLAPGAGVDAWHNKARHK